MTTVVAEKDMQWQLSNKTKGWEYVRLSGAHGTSTTILCRCSAGVQYHPWISDALVEYYVLDGDLSINGTTIHKGDYASVDPKTDGYLSSEYGMKSLCIMHGEVVRAKEVFNSMRNQDFSVDMAKKLFKLPWIDHLRNHIGDDDIETVVEMIQNASNDDAVRELCISIARNLNTPEILNAAKSVLKNDSIGMSFRITAVLYLASKEKSLSQEEWEDQLAIMKRSPDETLAVTKSFYNASDNYALMEAVNARISSGNYAYNTPFYNMLLSLL